MKIKLIACKALTREFSYLCAQSEHNIDITYIRQGYHNAPEVLRRNLQEEIDRIEGGNDPHSNENNANPSRNNLCTQPDFDVILIGYGICSKGTLGLTSKRYKIVIPKCHDCISLLLGSPREYKEAFNKYNGCFWYTASWIENSNMPSEETTAREIEYYKEQEYDDETIEYLLEDSKKWESAYNYAGYINMPFYNNDPFKDYTKKAAEFMQWDYIELEGKLTYMERFLNGDWDNDDFIVINPGEVVNEVNIS